MLIDILNFIFVYLFSGFILSLFIKLLTKKVFDNKLIFLLGYGISPLLISLLLYYLYSFFPSRDWIFYALIIYAVFAIFFIVSIKGIKRVRIKNILEKIKGVLNKTFQLDIFKKILLAFVLFVVIFTLIRNIFYPTTYTDAVEYLKQGFVYSQDHSHDRLKKRGTFSNFDKNNPLYGPEDKFQMNKAIRPALPIFYSFFYKDKNPTLLNFFSIDFIYSYYFLCLFSIVAYIINRFKPKNTLLGLTFLLSCYFLTKLSYSNYKIIITAFFAVTSLFLLYKINKNKKWVPAIFLGILCGLMIFINYTGLVIFGIISLIGLFSYKTKFSNKLVIILIILIFSSFFSGGEIKGYKNFIFNKNFLSSENMKGTYDSREFNSRLEGEGRKDLAEVVEGEDKKDLAEVVEGEDKKEILLYTLITKKLQAFTQFQFFGFIFWLFLVILIMILIKKRKLDRFSKINLAFIFIFFFIFFDPFFLNPHKYAYVLSLGYRYTATLSVFVAIFVALHYENFLIILKKIKLNYLKFILILFPLFVLMVREYMAKNLMTILKKITILTNPDNYYIEKLNLFLIYFAIFCFAFFIFIFIYQKNKQKHQLNLVNILFILSFFIFSPLFTINSNQNIINTFKYAFNKNASLKIQKVSKNKSEKSTFEVINYINQGIDPNSVIVLKNMPISFNFWLYTKNNRRISEYDNYLLKNKDYQNYPEDFYLLSNNDSRFEKNKIQTGINCSMEKEMNYSILWKCKKDSEF
jgi:hypothetical protein